MDGHKEATEIAEKIHLLLKKYPVSYSNTQEWFDFMKIVDNSVKHVMQEIINKTWCESLKVKVK